MSNACPAHIALLGRPTRHQYTLEVSAYETVYDAKTTSFHEGFRPWAVAHVGPARVTER